MSLSKSIKTMLNSLFFTCDFVGMSLNFKNGCRENHPAQGFSEPVELAKNRRIKAGGNRFAKKSENTAIVFLRFQQLPNADFGVCRKVRKHCKNKIPRARFSGEIPFLSGIRLDSFCRIKYSFSRINSWTTPPDGINDSSNLEVHQGIRFLFFKIRQKSAVESVGWPWVSAFSVVIFHLPSRAFHPPPSP